MNKLIALIFALSVTPAHAATLDATCVAKGRYGNGHSPLVTNSEISFRLSGDSDSATLREIRGTVMVAWDFDKDLSPDLLNNENAYVGHFRTSRISSNPAYSPRRYKNYLQFQKLDAAETTGNESGMWGDFVVEKTAFERRTETFQAHYIFQAGDHIGGTLHFTCTKQD